MKTRYALYGFAMAAFTIPVHAGESSISGTVLDASGMVVPAARVTVVQIDSGMSHKSVTDQAGCFRLVNLPDGRYRLRFDKTGYYPVEVPQVMLSAQESFRRQIQMKPAGAGGKVEAGVQSLPVFQRIAPLDSRPSILDPGTQAAQDEAKSAATLSLDSFLSEVLGRHPLIRAAEQQVNVAKGMVAQARAFPLPELSYEYSKTNNVGTLSELIEFPGKRRLRKQIAEIGVGQEQQSLLEVQSTVAYEARQAFFRRLLTEQQLSIAEQSLAAIRKIAELAQKRFEAGDVAQVEVIKAKVEAARAEQQVRITEGRRKVAGLAINMLLGRTQDAPVRIQGDLTASVRVAPLNELLQQAYHEQPGIAMARQETEKQEKSLLLARRQKFPDLTLGAMYGVEDRERTPGITLSVSIPSPGRNRGLVEEAAGRRLAALAQEEGQRYLVAQSLASAYEQWLAASAQVDVYRGGLLQQSETVLKTAEESYREGQSGILDVLDAERTDLMVHMEYQQALFELQVSAANVIFARGGTR